MSANTNVSVCDKMKHDDHDTTQDIPIIVNGEVIETTIINLNCSILVIGKLAEYYE